MGLMRHKVALRQKDTARPDEVPWRIESAGTWAMVGSPAASLTQLVLKQRGIDLGDHRARMVTQALLASFDLTLTMEAGHKEALRVEFPSVAGRVFQITEMIGQKYDIADPIGGRYIDFKATAQELDDLLERGMARILEGVGLAGGEQASG